MRERARARVAESVLANGITQETPVYSRLRRRGAQTEGGIEGSRCRARGRVSNGEASFRALEYSPQSRRSDGLGGTPVQGKSHHYAGSSMTL